MAQKLSANATTPVPKDVVDPINDPNARVTLASQQAQVDDWVGKVTQDVQSYTSETLETISRFSADAARQAGRAYRTGSDYAGNHPAGTVLAAFGFGILLGALLKD